MHAKNIRQAIDIMANISEKTLPKIAEEMGHTWPWLSYRMKTEKFSLPEWKQLCELCGFTFSMSAKSNKDDLVIAIGEDEDE